MSKREELIPILAELVDGIYSDGFIHGASSAEKELKSKLYKLRNLIRDHGEYYSLPVIPASEIMLRSEKVDVGEIRVAQIDVTIVEGMISYLFGRMEL